MFELVENLAQNAKIRVVGVGGGGGNAINTMMELGLEGVDFIAANTDVQSLHANVAPHKVQLGRELTKGLGAGANPDVGRNAALEDQRALAEELAGADMVFITAGMGGGTGTGGAPVIAKLAKELGALTVGVVTKPFTFEGKQRFIQADQGLNDLRESVDTLITIPNEKLLSFVTSDVTVVDAFKQADQVLYQAVKGIADLITVHGLINLDFADVRTVMNEMGMALMGTGTSGGETRAIEAATRAIASPLLEDTSIKGATGILINITGGSDMTLHEISEASKIIQEEAHEDANILFGAVIDDQMKDNLRVTVIATGFNKPIHRQMRSTLRRQSQPGAQGNQAGGFSVRQAPNPPQYETRTAPMAPSTHTATAVQYPTGATRHSPHEMVAPPIEESKPPVTKQDMHGEINDLTREVGVLEHRDDEYDIPTFLRKQAD
jgi:cell division protein FtsZ